MMTRAAQDVPMPHDTRGSWLAGALRWDALISGLRIAMGLAFVVPGLKVIFPSLMGYTGSGEVVEKFTDPTTGFLAPWLTETIAGFGIPVAAFLLIKGFADTVMGLMLTIGLATRMNAGVLAVLLWTFTIAAPDAGAIRLARDLTLAAVCVALVLAGGGRFSLDRRIAGTEFVSGPGARRGGPFRRIARALFAREAAPAGNRDLALLALRLGLALPLLTSAVFTAGPGEIFDNPQNSALPAPALLGLGALLVLGIAPRWVMLAVAGFMAWLVIEGLAADWFYVGLDNMKREITMFAAAGLYAIVGPDQWSRPRPQRVHCRDVPGLLMAYVDNTVDQRQRSVLETHFTDCPECWRFVASYGATVGLGQRLREEDIPAEVHERLKATISETTGEHAHAAAGVDSTMGGNTAGGDDASGGYVARGDEASGGSARSTWS